MKVYGYLNRQSGGAKWIAKTAVGCFQSGLESVRESDEEAAGQQSGSMFYCNPPITHSMNL